MPRNQGAVKTVHGEVEGGIIVLNRADAVPNGNFRIKLLFYFTGKSLLRGFPFLDFSPGKFPPVFEFPVTSLGAKISFLPDSDLRKITAATTFIVFILTPLFFIQRLLYLIL